MVPRSEFIKQVNLSTIDFGVLPWLNHPGMAMGPYAPFRLPRSTPESQGISSSGITRFLDAIKESEQEFHNLMILRHGHVVTEGWWAPYSSEQR